MTRARLTIDLDAVAANWRALDALSAPEVETGAVVKADAYGLGLAPVAAKLRAAGAQSFFVALAEEGAALRRVIGPDPDIFVFSGYMEGDRETVAANALLPLLNSAEQAARFAAEIAETGCGVQLDTGMNRLGLEAEGAARVATSLAPGRIRLVMSHLACADAPEHAQNAAQLAEFKRLTGLFPGLPLSLAATGGILLGADYHHALTRPGIGLYGGLPFADADPVVALELPVIQTRTVAPSETVGYGASWTARRESRIATLAAGYADGLIRAMGNRAVLHAGAAPCPLAGRVSMDLLTVDVTDLPETPDALSLIGPHQGVDAVAEAAGTIGYEILTSLGPRYERVYKGSV